MGFFTKLGGGVSAGHGGMLGGLSEIFSPSRKHTTEEQERQRISRQRADAGEPDFDGPVDFKKMSVHIRKDKKY